MNQGKFYTPEAMAPQLPEIVPTYQEAFKKEPWYEVSKCPDRLQRCTGGMSAVAVNETCTICNLEPKRPAYETEELIPRFEELGKTRPTVWYTESVDNRTALAAVAWKTDINTIVNEKYTDVPEMTEWIDDVFGNGEIVWLDEVFADSRVRISGNLRNFGIMCRGFADQLNSSVLAFRTINPRMTAAAKRDFADSATILRRQVDVPDRRDFVIINLNGESS